MWGRRFRLPFFAEQEATKSIASRPTYQPTGTQRGATVWSAKCCAMWGRRFRLPFFAEQEATKSIASRPTYQPTGTQRGATVWSAKCCARGAGGSACHSSPNKKQQSQSHHGPLTNRTALKEARQYGARASKIGFHGNDFAHVARAARPAEPRVVSAFRSGAVIGDCTKVIS